MSDTKRKDQIQKAACTAIIDLIAANYNKLNDELEVANGAIGFQLRLERRGSGLGCTAQAVLLSRVLDETESEVH